MVRRVREKNLRCCKLGAVALLVLGAACSTDQQSQGPCGAPLQGKRLAVCPGSGDAPATAGGLRVQAAINGPSRTSGKRFTVVSGGFHAVR